MKYLLSESAMHRYLIWSGLAQEIMGNSSVLVIVNSEALLNDPNSSKITGFIEALQRTSIQKVIYCTGDSNAQPISVLDNKGKMFDYNNPSRQNTVIDLTGLCSGFNRVIVVGEINASINLAAILAKMPGNRQVLVPMNGVNSNAHAPHHMLFWRTMMQTNCGVNTINTFNFSAADLLTINPIEDITNSFQRMRFTAS